MGVKIMPSLKNGLSNMSAPMLWHCKLYLLMRNNYIKLRYRQSCCEHIGIPK